ncbi:potassium-transporting ATPase subunit KdpB [Kovacikia minuta]
MEVVAEVALAASVFDETPEGKSIARLAEKYRASMNFDLKNAEGVEFSARTRMSGTNLPDGREVRKGAVDAIKGFVRSRGGTVPPQLDEAYERVSRLGGTPLAVCQDQDIYGVIYLKDMVKPGLRERFDQLRRMGVKTIMLTGDNRITASVIAQEAGVDDFIAEATPEDKIDVIRKEQSEGKLVAMTGDGTNDAPALAQANVGLAMNSGTQAAKEAANMVDLDSDPTKLIDLVTIGKQLLITRGALTTFSIANDIAKYFAIIPTIFAAAGIGALNIMGLKSPQSAVISALIYNALIIPALIPLALKGVQFRPLTADQLLRRNILIYGAGGVIAPFIAIKLIDVLIPLS